MVMLTPPKLLPPDDPIFSSGPEIFSRPGSSESTQTSASDTAGVTQAKSDSASRLETLRELQQHRELTKAEMRELGGLASAEYAKTLE